MGLSNNIGTYADIMRLLATAVRRLEDDAARGTPRPQVQFSALSAAAAIHTRQRCHKYRTLLGDEQAAAGMGRRTRYDALVLTIEDNVIIFRLRGEDTLPGTLTASDGSVLPLVEEDASLPDFDVEV